MHHDAYEFKRFGVQGFEQLVQQEPQNPSARFDLGLAYINARRFADAVQAFLDTLAIDPTHYAARAYLGWSYSKLSRYDEAIATLEQLPKELPELLMANFTCWLGEAYYGAEKLDAALDAFSRALAAGDILPDVHDRLTTLSFDPRVKMDRPRHCKAPVTDTTFHFQPVNGSDDQLSCRLRIFETEGRTVVLLSDHSGSGVVDDFVEAIYEKLVIELPTQMSAADIYIAVFGESGGFGEMRISRATFQLESVSILGRPERKILTAQLYDASFEDFEELTGCRLHWKRRESSP